MTGYYPVMTGYYPVKTGPVQDHFRPLQTTSDHFKPLQTTSNHFNHFKPLQTTSDHFKPLQANHFRPLQATSERIFRPLEASIVIYITFYSIALRMQSTWRSSPTTRPSLWWGCSTSCASLRPAGRTSSQPTGHSWCGRGCCVVRGGRWRCWRATVDLA